MSILKDIVTLDFETFWEPGYSLRSKKISTTEYIRDPRFKAHGAALRLPGQRKARWVSHARLSATLKKIDWKNKALLCHNTAFDGLILSHHYGCVPALYLDTLSMSRGLFGSFVPHDLDSLCQRLEIEGKIKGVLEGTKGLRDLPPELEKALGVYACQDADATFEAFRRMAPVFPRSELDLLHLTIKAYADPVLQVDEAEARRVLEKEEREQTALVKKAGVDEKVLSSNQQFAELLHSRGVTPPTKISKTTGEETTAFAKNDLNFQALADHPKVGDIVKARMAVKSTIGITRARRLLSHGVPGPLPVMLNYAQAHTQRWSGGDKINMQNLPRIDPKDKSLPSLRKAIRPPKGQKIIVIDSSQIEDRTNCALAGQEDVLNIYRDGGDNYALLASEIYGRHIDKHDDPEERFVGKVARLGLGYQMGAPKFQYTLASGAMGPPMFISLEVAEQAVRTYRRKNRKIVEQWSFFQRMLTRMMDPDCFVEYGPIVFRHERVDGPNGLSLHYPGLQGHWNPYRNEYSEFSYQTPKGRTKIYGGLLTENVVQWLARIIVAEQILKIAEHYRIVLLVHDEVVYLASARGADLAYRRGLKAFHEVPSWLPNVPVAGEGGIFDCYMKP